MEIFFVDLLEIFYLLKGMYINLLFCFDKKNIFRFFFFDFYFLFFIFIFYFIFNFLSLYFFLDTISHTIFLFY